MTSAPTNEELAIAARAASIDLRILDAPCIFCGYNGAGYWQKGTHTPGCLFQNVGGDAARADILRDEAAAARLSESGGGQQEVAPGEPANSNLSASPPTLSALVERQANDPALWFVAQTAPEAYLQKALRELHRAIEESPAVPDLSDEAQEVVEELKRIASQVSAACARCGEYIGLFDQEKAHLELAAALIERLEREKADDLAEQVELKATIERQSREIEVLLLALSKCTDGQTALATARKERT